MSSCFPNLLKAVNNVMRINSSNQQLLNVLSASCRMFDVFGDTQERCVFLSQVSALLRAVEKKDSQGKLDFLFDSRLCVLFPY